MSSLNYFLKKAQLLILLCGLLSLQTNRAHSASNDRFTPSTFRWGRWTKGVELGGRALGRFGKGDNINIPPGDFMTELQGYIWYQHFVSVHTMFGLGMSNSTFMMGGGAKFNLWEILSDPTGVVDTAGMRRGILGKILQNFMFHVGADARYYFFPDPATGLSYEPKVLTFEPSLGVQWYFDIPNTFGSRYYVSMSMAYSSINQSHYLMPFIGLGVALR